MPLKPRLGGKIRYYLRNEQTGHASAAQPLGRFVGVGEGLRVGIADHGDNQAALVADGDADIEEVIDNTSNLPSRAN